MPLPNFLVVGAAKCGTTSLFDILKQSPEIYIPQMKECRFFSQMPRNFKGGMAAKFQNEGPRDLGEYLSLYESSTSLISGDLSNDYFYYYQKTIENIHSVYNSCGQRLPKIIIILRNPVDRVISMYNHTVRLKSTVHDFLFSFENSSNYIKDGYSWQFDLQGLGLSYEPTKAYISSFSDVFLMKTADLSDPDRLSKLQEFLDLKNSLHPLPHKSMKITTKYQYPNP